MKYRYFLLLLVANFGLVNAACESDIRRFVFFELLNLPDLAQKVGFSSEYLQECKPFIQKGENGQNLESFIQWVDRTVLVDMKTLRYFLQQYLVQNQSSKKLRQLFFDRFDQIPNYKNIYYYGKFSALYWMLHYIMAQECKIVKPMSLTRLLVDYIHDDVVVLAEE